MVWDYAWQAGPAGGLLPLGDYLTSIRLERDESAGVRKVDFIIPHRPGVDPDVVELGMVNRLSLIANIRPTNNVGVVTHANGAEGHVSQNLATVRRLLRTTREPHLLQRDIPATTTAAPTGETVQLSFRGDAVHEVGTRKIRAVLRAVWPYWRSTVQRSVTINGAGVTVPIQGDAPVADAVLEFAGASVLTYDRFSEDVEILGGGATDVDCGARTVLTNPGGTDNGANFLPDQPWWMVFEPAAAVTLSRTGANVVVRWRDQYGA